MSIKIKQRSSRKFQKMKGPKQKWIKTNKQKWIKTNKQKYQPIVENDRINYSNQKITNRERARTA